MEQFIHILAVIIYGRLGRALFQPPLALDKAALLIEFHYG